MAKKMWGGRFAKKTDPLVEEFTRSIQYDHKLVRYDVFGSLAHVHILRKAGILTKSEALKLAGALKTIRKSVNNGTYKPDSANEDIHTDIQNKLEKKVGDLALKLHTARSRNDQVVLAVKMYCKMEILQLKNGISELGMAICRLAAKYEDMIMPGFTHMQHAQPVYLKDYLLAYNAMLERDYARLEFIVDTIKITMGAGALAGTPIEAEHYDLEASEFLKEEGYSGKGFDIQVTTNSLDTVSDRDFIIEILSTLAIIGMHLSRLSEDLIIWNTEEFDFVEIDDAFSTGSSLMPQKKNPDVLELIRGYSGRLYGNLVSVLTMMKGLPLTYNRDMQLDKEPLFESFEIVLKELKVMAGLIKTLKFNRDKVKKHLTDESLYATDIVYYLVHKGVAFKTAHTIVGKLIKYSLDNSTEIKKMTEEDLKKYSDKFVKKEVVKLFDPAISVKAKRSVRRKSR